LPTVAVAQSGLGCHRRIVLPPAPHGDRDNVFPQRQMAKKKVVKKKVEAKAPGKATGILPMSLTVSRWQES
jgi:hypothetical protein